MKITLLPYGLPSPVGNNADFSEAPLTYAIQCLYQLKANLTLNAL